MAEQDKRRGKSAKQLEADLARLKEREKEVKRALAEKRKSEAARAKDWRTNAGMQVAGYVWKTLGLEWDCFDMERFEEQFAAVASKKYDTGAPIFDCAATRLDAPEARKRWQDHAAGKRAEALAEATERSVEAAAAAVGVKEWKCPVCGRTGTVPSRYWYKECECGHRVDLS